MVAVDLHARKAQQAEETARRLGLPEVRALAADATLPIPGEAPFDVALVDAPCSGFGTLRRHPEVKLRRTPEDVDRTVRAAHTAFLQWREVPVADRGHEGKRASFHFLRFFGPKATGCRRSSVARS